MTGESMSNRQRTLATNIPKERLAEIAAIPEEKIDTSDIPEMDEKFFAVAKLVMPPLFAAPHHRSSRT